MTRFIDGGPRRWSVHEVGRSSGVEVGAALAPKSIRASRRRALERCRRHSLKPKLDRHEIYHRGGDIDHARRSVVDEAIYRGVRHVEIIQSRGNGQMRKHLLRFLDQKEIQSRYDRVEKDAHNFERGFVHFLRGSSPVSPTKTRRRVERAQ